MRERRHQPIEQIRDAYLILGLEPGSPLAEAKRAFRRLVKRFHPDVSSDPPEIAAQKTRQLFEAFGRLRSMNDAELASARRIVANPERESARGFRAASAPEPRPGGTGRRGRDVVGDLVLNHRQALWGSRWRLQIATCRACAGWGAAVGSAFEICSDCCGIGRHRRRDGSWNLDAQCPTCSGYGCRFKQPCSACGGSGEGSFFDVSCWVPAMDPCSDVLRRVEGQGHRGLAGGRAGDLYLRITTRTKTTESRRQEPRVSARKESRHV